MKLRILLEIQGVQGLFPKRRWQKAFHEDVKSPEHISQEGRLIVELPPEVGKTPSPA